MATLLIPGDLQASDLSISNPIQHFGASDGSAAIACGGRYFAAATDENNVLRLYSVDDGSIGLALLELNQFKLGDAAKKAPKEEGGLNIESLCAVGETLYIGFRNPIPNGKALIVPLVNPSAVVDEGKPAQLGKPILIDLGGLGLRDMA